jgi:hypothetical protein
MVRHWFKHQSSRGAAPPAAGQRAERSINGDQNALNVIVVSVRWMPGMSNSFDDR